MTLYLTAVPHAFGPIAHRVRELLFVGGIGLIATALLSFLKLRDRRHLLRELDLRNAVSVRTEELERERARERARSGILEMLVANQSLGLVLDGIVQLIRNEIPAARCAVLLHRADRTHIAATLGIPPDWIAALNAPHAIPFEVRKQPCVFETPATDPAWKIFTGGIESPPPASVYSQPIGNPDSRTGAILVFGMEAFPDGAEIGAEVLPYAARLSQISIEHSRFYDDLRFRAHHDGLTGLPNRVLFEERLSRAVTEARSLRQRLAILYVDLDRFKQINDSMSHRIGDLILCEVAARLGKALRPGDTVARIGGDEFNVLLPDIAANAEAEAISERILKSIRQTMHIEGRTLVVSASVGIAFFPEDGEDAEDLQRDADAAMYCAKGLGRDRVQSFSARNDSLDRVRMEREIRAGLRDNWFVVHYQPKISANGLFGGMEALVRLNHPLHGQIPPAQFIPLSEETGLIVPLGGWVLEEVCRQIAAWRAAGFGEIPVAVNVSPVQIARPDFAQVVEDSLARHAVSPFTLELELTESLLIGGGEESQQQMRRLRAIGITFSIDDFGTGYSSLSYLHRLKVDAIKLDRSFVQSIDTDEAARRLVQAMIGVAQGLGLNVIAEGVETEAQRSALVAAGCPMMQGYLFSRPQPPDALVEFLSQLASDPDDLFRLARVAGPALPLEEVLYPV